MQHALEFMLLFDAPSVCLEETETAFCFFRSCKAGIADASYSRQAIGGTGKKHKVPKVLLSGNHAEIDKWKQIK